MFDLEFLIVSQPTAETPSPFRSASERAADRERKREAVLLAAVKAFNQHGFHAASLDEALAMAHEIVGEEAKVTVIPNGISVIVAE